MENKIILTRTAQGWMAQYQGLYSDEVFRLFGTRTLPTGFTERASSAIVKSSIQNLNPSFQVLVI